MNWLGQALRRIQRMSKMPSPFVVSIYMPFGPNMSSGISRTSSGRRAKISAWIAPLATNSMPNPDARKKTIVPTQTPIFQVYQALSHSSLICETVT